MFFQKSLLRLQKMHFLTIKYSKTAILWNILSLLLLRPLGVSRNRKRKHEFTPESEVSLLIYVILIYSGKLTFQQALVSHVILVYAGLVLKKYLLLLSIQIPFLVETVILFYTTIC